jgi:sulfite reductase alpha subunit-like flavoprotein
VGRSSFYYGARSQGHDVLYLDEFTALTSLHLALSKDDGRRVPVLLARDGALLYQKLVTKQGYLYVSGSAKSMPADVRETMVQAFGTHGGLSREEAVKEIRKMERERRYIVDAWS